MSVQVILSRGLRWLCQRWLVFRICRAEDPINTGILGTARRAELIRLRAEAKDDKAAVAELQMQVEFAKKVATWFAREKQ
jgi:transposase